MSCPLSEQTACCDLATAPQQCNTVIADLRKRITELESELRRHKETSGRGEKILKMMWGDNFDDESLH